MKRILHIIMIKKIKQHDFPSIVAEKSMVNIALYMIMSVYIQKIRLIALRRPYIAI